MSLVERLEKRIATMREAGAAAAGTILQTAEIGAVAFGFGVAKAKWGDKDLRLTVAGIDADLLVGVAGHGLAFAGVFGNYDEHVHNVADGALGVWAHAKGLQVGAEWKAKPLQFEASGRRMSPSDQLKERLSARR